VCGLHPRCMSMCTLSVRSNLNRRRRAPLCTPMCEMRLCALPPLGARTIAACSVTRVLNIDSHCSHSCAHAFVALLTLLLSSLVRSLRPRLRLPRLPRVNSRRASRTRSRHSRVRRRTQRGGAHSKSAATRSAGGTMSTIYMRAQRRTTPRRWSWRRGGGERTAPMTHIPSLQTRSPSIWRTAMKPQQRRHRSMRVHLHHHHRRWC
jgi:hypothetical protein